MPKAIKFKRDVYHGWDGKKLAFTHDPKDSRYEPLILFKRTHETVCADESQYQEYVDAGLELTVEIDIPEEKWQRFIQRYGELIRKDPDMSNEEVIQQASREIEAEWAAEGHGSD